MKKQRNYYMQRKIQKYIFDIKESIESIADFLGSDCTFDHYTTNKLLRRAVERELEIIGEATNRILKLDPDINITDSRRIVDLRNWVIHGYEQVDDVIIWGIIKKDIPKFYHQIKKLI